MATTKPKINLVVIVGPTASGKSDLAMKIARNFDGEIIAADSRTIYKGMDIGTAKASAKDQKQIKHWGLDLVEPGERFSAAQFKEYAEDAIKNIQARSKLPILVGGTGLYIDSILFDFNFISSSKPDWLYSWRSTKSLQKTINKKHWTMPENFKNKRHLIRTIQREGQIGSRAERPSGDILLLGLTPNDELLRQRIAKRAQIMFKSGVIEETEMLLKHYSEKKLRSTGGIIYGILIDLIRGKISINEAQNEFIKKDWQYARRQKTWFKRNPDIKWFNTLEGAYTYLTKHL